MKEVPTENLLIIEKDNSVLGTLKNELAEARNEIIEKTVTIAKMSDEIENLLESSAMVNAKINLLENDLLEERQQTLKYKNDLDTLKQKLISSEALLEKRQGEDTDLQKQVAICKMELEKRPTVESFSDLQNTCETLKQTISVMREQAKLKEEEKPQKIDVFRTATDEDEIRLKFADLEEELVVVKEQYAKSLEEKITVNRSLERLEKDYRDLTNRSHNVMFFYIAPLVFLVAYLMFTTLIS